MALLRGMLITILLLALAACNRPFGSASQPSQCGPPSPIDPHLRVAVAGPLAFYGGLGTTHAIVGDFAPGIPAKVGISAVPPLTTPVTLEGWDCSTGTRLRFWYHPGSPFGSVLVTAAQLAGTGDLVAVLPPDDRGVYPGYILFTHPGDWKVEVRQGGRSLGSVVFDVLDPNGKESD